MRLIPRCFYNKELLSLINFYIDLNNKSYSSLNDSDKEIITAKCIEILGEDAYQCIIDSPNLANTLSNLSKFLKSGSSENAYDLVRTMAENATTYFEDTMNDLFDETIKQQHEFSMIEKGFSHYVDKVNGEISWRKTA